MIGGFATLAAFRATSYLWMHIDLTPFLPDLYGFDPILTRVANDYPVHQTYLILIGISVLLVFWLISGLSGIFTFVTADMIWSGYKNDPLSLKKSSKFALERIGRFYLAALVANLLSITIILLPASLFMYAIMVVDDTNIREALSKGFHLSVNRVKTSIGLILLFFLLYFVSYSIPPASEIVTSVLTTFLLVAAIDINVTYSKHIPTYPH